MGIVDTLKSIPLWEWGLMVGMTIAPMIGGIAIGLLSDTSIFRDGILVQPSWAPPSWLFGPVWTVLYLMMGFSSYLMLKQGEWINRATISGLILYLVQLVFNFAWTLIFFNGRHFATGVLEIGAVWGLILATIITFAPVSWVAAVLLVPYLAWVSFASALAHSILCLNDCDGSSLVFSTTTTTAAP